MTFRCRSARRFALVLWLSSLGAGAHGQTVEEELWNAKFQATYVWQGKGAVAASYSGVNSLSTQRERSYSFTTTMALGWRPWQGGEVYVNAEGTQGVALSGLTGLGGFTNGEIARTSGPNLTIFRARAFLRQTWDLGTEREAVASDMNQLGGMVARRRVVLTAGNLSALDLFDDNAYSHDPRTQFMNWSLMAHGAYDYAADARGYSWGFAVEVFHDEWVLRAGRFAQPKQPNQLPLDARLFSHYGDQVELERAYAWLGRPGKLRLLAFRNRARMARFQDALDLAATNGTVPDLGLVRTQDRVKVGLGLNIEQELTDGLGVFVRASQSDGRTEAYAFTEIDRSLSAGVSVNGRGWGRPHDVLGIAVVRNGLSAEHRDFLAAGGLGFFIGDGALNYRPEAILEAYYSQRIRSGAWLTVGWQHIRHPAYNADRGPARIGSIRFHTEF